MDVTGSRAYLLPLITNFYLHSLAEFYSCPSVLLSTSGHAELSPAHTLAKLSPRLWPFLRHTIAAVRHSALKTLGKLLAIGVETAFTWLPAVLSDTLGHIFKLFLVEERAEIIEEAHSVWNQLVSLAQVRTLTLASENFPDLFTYPSRARHYGKLHSIICLSGSLRSTAHPFPHRPWACPLLSTRRPPLLPQRNPREVGLGNKTQVQVLPPEVSGSMPSKSRLQRRSRKRPKKGQLSKSKASQLILLMYLEVLAPHASQPLKG